MASTRIRRFVLAVGLSLTLVACGGGSGGGGGPSSPGDPATAPGLTLSQSSVALAAFTGQGLPAPVDVQVVVSATDAAQVVAGYPSGTTPPTWLQPSISVQGNVATVRLAFIGALNEGDYAATLRIGLLRADQSPIAYRDLQISLRVRAPLVPAGARYSIGGLAGNSTQTVGSFFVIAPPGVDWSVSSSVPWLSLSANDGTGQAALSVLVNAQNLQPGTYTAVITITGSNGAVQSVPVTFAVSPPVLNVSTRFVFPLGGLNGREPLPQDINLSLSTGTNTYSWSVSGVPSWLQLSSSGGLVGGTSQTIILTPLTTGLAPGRYTATLRFSATVNSLPVTLDYPVEFRLDAHRLIATETGVSLVSTPAWTHLSRTLTIRSNFDLRPAWTATSDAAWLTVTNSGTAGGALTLTATPAALASDQFHLATITVTSPDPSITAPERIRVGLWKGSSTPTGATRISGFFGGTAIDPVRPYVYAHQGDTQLRTFNLFTGQEVLPAIGGFGQQLGDMVVSPDGSYLYALVGGSAGRIAKVDLAARAIVNSWPIGVAWQSSRARMALARTNGTEVLIVNDQKAYLTSDGSILGSTPVNGQLAASPVGNQVWALIDSRPTTSIIGIDLDYSLGAPEPLLTSWSNTCGNESPIQIDGVDPADLLFSPSGEEFVFAVRSRDFVEPLEIPNGVFLPPLQGCRRPVALGVTADNRLFCAGSSLPAQPQREVFVYSPQRSLLRTITAAGNGSEPIAMRTLALPNHGLMAAFVLEQAELQILPVGP